MKKKSAMTYLVFMLWSFCWQSFMACGEPLAIDGTWKGDLEMMGRMIEIILHFRTENGRLKAAIDIPIQGAKGLELREVIYEHPKIAFQLVTPVATGYFEGAVEGDTLIGEFRQSGVTGTFSLIRVRESEGTQSRERLPYLEKDITFNNGPIKLAGTLTLPIKKGKHPAVILISGSGPQNRDEELFGWKIFAGIADYLTRLGIAVLRYDDRGVGQSTGNVLEATTADFFPDFRS